MRVEDVIELHDATVVGVIPGEINDDNVVVKVVVGGGRVLRASQYNISSWGRRLQVVPPVVVVVEVVVEVALSL